MDIAGDTQILGLIGQNIHFSLSPFIHNLAIAHLGKRAVYLPFPWASEPLDPLLEVLWQLGCQGINVTAPYKITAGHYVGLSSAVNTLSRGKTSWAGHSTDGAGFFAALDRRGAHPLAIKKFVIIGAGGATSAILASAPDLFPKLREIHILVRRPAKAKSLADVLTLPMSFHKLQCPTLQRLLKGQGKETLLIQASGAPHHGDDLSYLEDALEGFKGSMIDLCYHQTSRLYDRANAVGLNTQDGEIMLIEQAREAQKIWWGESAPFDFLFQNLRRALKRTNA